MAPATSQNGALVRVQDLSSALDSRVTLMSENSLFNVKNDERGHDEKKHLIQFLRFECQTSWHPSFRYGVSAVSSIGDCLADVGDARLSHLKLMYFETQAARNIDPGRSVRSAVEECRQLCMDALGSVEHGMGRISSKSGTLAANAGPIMKVVNVANSMGKEGNRTALDHHIIQMTEGYETIMAEQTKIVHQWRNLNTVVSRLKSILGNQLEMIGPRQRDLQNQISSRDSILTNYQSSIRSKQSKISATSNELQEVERVEADSTKALSDLEDELRLLNDKLAIKKQELHNLKLGSTSKEDQFERARERAKKRQKEYDERNSQSSMGTWLWNLYWYGSEEYAAKTAGCGEEVAHSKWRKASAEMEAALENDIIALQADIQVTEVRKTQLNDGRQEKCLNEQEIKKRAGNNLLFRLDTSLAEYTGLVADLQEEINVGKQRLAELASFEKVVPALCSHLGQAETDIALTCKAYESLIARIQDYKPKVENFASIMRDMDQRRWNNVKEDILEDVGLLRLNFAVVHTMSTGASNMSREVYQEALRHIAPLGTVPHPDSVVRSRLIRTSNLRLAHDDIDNLHSIADQVAGRFDTAQRTALCSLSEVVDDIVNSTSSRRLLQGRRSSNRSRIWGSISRQQRAITSVEAIELP